MIYSEEWLILKHQLYFHRRARSSIVIGYTILGGSQPLQ